MKLMLTGAAGMLGLDLADELVARRHAVYALTRADLDITRAGDVEDAVAEIRPDVLVNCAAWTDVDGAEAHEAEAMRVNDTGAALLARAARDCDAAVLYVSSDYVFDGSKEAPYVESDLPHALSAYGRSKQSGETSVAVANPRHFIVRSSWLYGTRGGNFVETMLRLASEQPEVLVVCDQVGSPTYTRHLSRALADLLETDDYGIHHLAAAGRCSWFDFAQEIFDQAGAECRVMAATTDMLARPARRPAFSVLGTERANPIRLPEWHQGLREYLAERVRVPA